MLRPPIEFSEKINKQFDLTLGENFFSDSLHTFVMRALSSDSCARKDTSVHKLRTTLPDFETEALDRALHTEEGERSSVPFVEYYNITACLKIIYRVFVIH